MALADGALYGIESFENLWDMSIPDGDNALPLRWKDEVLLLPVIRNATIAHGVTNARLPKRTLKGSSSRYYIHQDILAQQRFMQYAAHWARSSMVSDPGVLKFRVYMSLTIYFVERYSEVQGSQHINQSMHVHTCRRQEIAHQLERMPSELNYCHDCFD